MGTDSVGPFGLDPCRDATAIGLGGVFAALVGVSLWASVVGYAAQHASRWLGGSLEPLLFVSGGTSLVGLVLGSAVYARYLGLDFGLSLPRRGTRRTTVHVLLAPAVLTVGTALVGNALSGVTLSAMTQRWVSPDAPPSFLLVTVGGPAAFVGLGYGVLFCGLVYERVEELVGPGHAVGVAAALVGFFRLLPVEALTALPLSVGSAVELVLSLVFGVAFGAGLGVSYRYAGGVSPGARLDRRHLLVLAVAALGVVGVLTELTELPRAAGDVLWVLVLGVGVLGYARTRSVWVPALAITVFQVTLAAAVYAEALLGLAGP
jgi:hypothetical protein